ncbi:sigma 54-interacting transcriptional regulator [Desulfoscipio geothermicus]|uniref:Transcriptional regulator containing PAS, AAA-type ATPase, and DNA-binding Fis domains n=1 Tax=Desulfoscipio geothermicus DSM 3669 TaxID=1121426 RepID=A0A1I6DGN7_9FIRM|nr:sigma 54-interacting transcriptional regulator [Desulfoscipio geothermicus]SFR04551.1 Transcriptional regulator containing PAS, AAA-type ATPase, and DNA-binding Fis domains [Desulfoscipio geothermicus DSM 3669]
MALPKIGIISPHAGFSKAAGELAGEIGLDLVVGEHKQKNVAALLKKWQNGDAVEAVVTSEVFAASVRDSTILPLVTVQLSAYDVLQALDKARAVGERVALAVHDCAYRFDPAAVFAMLGLKARILRYRNKARFTAELLQVREDLDAVVGTAAAAVQAAGEVGLPAFLVQNDREFIRDALEKAVQISRIRRRDVRLCRSLQAILSNAYDGILAVDERGKVAIFNPVAQKITGLPVEKALGHPVAQVIEINAVCRGLYGDGGAANGEILQLGRFPLVVNRVPVSLGQNRAGLVITFQAADKIRQMEAKIRKELHCQGLLAWYRFSDIIGHSAMMEEAVREARKYARSDAAVLITGESGTGKELFAQSIHNASARRDGPFLAINCAALPESLLESELFGYEEGAFTGARKGGKQGLFALAHGGTIFLDEIGDLSHALQARLLRVLQQKEVLPVGGQRVIPVDVRVISATNRNLLEAVERGGFRVDLYYRLNVLHLHIPPLRMRLEDLPLLFKHFFQRLAGPERLQEMQINDGLLEELKGYLWPGNVRELEGFVERYTALGEENVHEHVTFRNLLRKMKQNQQVDPALNNERLLVLKLGSMEDMEREIIRQAVDLVGGSKGKLARVLGLSRTTLWKKLKEIEENS